MVQQIHIDTDLSLSTQDTVLKHSLHAHTWLSLTLYAVQMAHHIRHLEQIESCQRSTEASFESFVVLLCGAWLPVYPVNMPHMPIRSSFINIRPRGTPHALVIPRDRCAPSSWTEG